MRPDDSRFRNGAAQPNLAAASLKKFRIPVPPLAEQQRIVRLLDEAFAGLATAKANAEKNLQNARALFESHLQSVLRNKKWKWKTLGELCDDVEYGSSAKSKAEGKVPVLRMGNIQNGRLDWDNLAYTDDKAEIKEYLLKHNDVLFNRTNSPELVGKTAIYKSEMPAIFAGYLIRINRKEDLLDADCLPSEVLLTKEGEATLGNASQHFPQPQRGCVHPVRARRDQPIGVIEPDTPRSQLGNSEWLVGIAQRQNFVPFWRICHE